MQLRPNLDIYALRNNFEQNNQFQEKKKKRTNILRTDSRKLTKNH